MRDQVDLKALAMKRVPPVPEITDDDLHASYKLVEDSESREDVKRDIDNEDGLAENNNAPSSRGDVVTF